MFKNQRSISIFLPVYNEEQNIDLAISTVLNTVSSISDDYEILLINDGSSDGSREKILEWAGRNANIRLVDHEINLGYGAALRSGFKNAKKDIVFYTDSDMPADMEQIKKILPLMEKYDLVIGYRINREDTVRRFIYSKIYNLLLRLLFNVRVRDANFSFKCIRREAVQKCVLKAKSVFIDGELLSEAVRNNFKIKEVPVIYTPRKKGSSNFDSLNAAVSTVKELMNSWLERRFPAKKRK